MVEISAAKSKQGNWEYGRGRGRKTMFDGKSKLRSLPIRQVLSVDGQGQQTSK